jgi:hypothetical protein
MPPKRCRCSAEVSGIERWWVCGVLLGILAKTGRRTWCFCGEFVVKCVVNVDRKQSLLWWANVGQVFEVYFRGVPCGRVFEWGSRP